jgi:hypothetical protein
MTTGRINQVTLVKRIAGSLGRNDLETRYPFFFTTAQKRTADQEALLFDRFRKYIPNHGTAIYNVC